MKYLLEREQFEKAAQILEKDGKYEQAVGLYIKSKRLVRLPKLMVQHDDLLRDNTLVTNVLKNLLKNDLFEGAAEIYEKLDKSDMAMQCYRKGICKLLA